LKTNGKSTLNHAVRTLSLLGLALATALAADDHGNVLILTSTNNPNANGLAVFKLNASPTPSLSLTGILPTGGAGGAAGNGGSVQFHDNSGAVVNFGSNTITQLNRHGDFITTGRTINLAPGCRQPLSVALTESELYVVGTNCVESHDWPSGRLEAAVPLADSSAGQVVAGKTWAAVTLKSGSVLQLPLTAKGSLAGTSLPVTLPANANDTPLGAAFWGDLLGFNPAHSANSFALVNRSRNVFPVLGPQPVFPANAPCWLAKGPGSIWYSANSPGQSIAIFFSDGRGGSFYQSVPLPGTPTDVTVSENGKWLAVIYTAADGSGGRIAVFAIDPYGDLSLVATSNPIGVAEFNGVAISQ
jgi:hypothetical protein